MVGFDNGELQTYAIEDLNKSKYQLNLFILFFYNDDCMWADFLFFLNKSIWYTLFKLKKKELHVLFLLISVPHDLFWPDLPKSLAKISQSPENRKDWSK